MTANSVKPFIKTYVEENDGNTYLTLPMEEKTLKKMKEYTGK